ncbi:MAG: hypothetical protein WC242_00625 [Candidatus Paceibacterota bacterium]|jgi:hypothetical protein
MVFDNIIAFFLNNWDRFYHFPDSSELKIRKKLEISKNSSTLKIILPPRGDGDTSVTRILMKRFVKEGYSCLAYFFPKHLLLTNAKKTVEIYDFVQDYTRKDIAEIKKKYHFKRIDIVAPSLGIVSACLMANDNPDISSLYAIAPGSCLATSLWSSNRMEKLRRIYESQGIDLEKLQKLWGHLAPKNNIDDLNNKKIFVALSKSDKVVPYSHGKEFAELLKKQYGANVMIQKNFCLGHYLTVVKYFLFSRELMK